MLAKFLLPIIVVLLLFGLTLNFAADLLQPLPLLARVIGMVLAVVGFFYLVGKLMKLLALRVFAKVSKNVAVKLPGNVHGELHDIALAPLPYLDIPSGSDNPANSEKAVRVRFSFSGIEHGVHGELDPSNFALAAASDTASFSPLFSSEHASDPQAFAKMMQAMQSQMAVAIFKPDWIRVLDRRGKERLSASANEIAHASSKELPLKDELFIELFFASQDLTQGKPYVLRYGHMPLFEVLIPDLDRSALPTSE